MSRTVVLLLLLLPAITLAQETRFELGQRLRYFERALDKHPSPEARKRALEPLEQATPTFFKGQLATAAGLLDRARLLLEHAQPADELLWAESLIVKPQRRLYPCSANAIPLKIEQFYRVSVEQPNNTQLRFTLLDPTGKASDTLTVKEFSLPFPTTFKIKPLVEGDYLLRTEVLVNGKSHANGEMTLSFVDRLDDRLSALKKQLEDVGPKDRTTESATAGRLLSILSDLQAGRTLETNYPAARLVKEAEDALAAHQAKKPFYTPERTGQFWLTLVSGNETDPVRVQIPESAKQGKPLPLVVAMHGAGGSENMFFDGYGDGLVAKLCEKRGWLLVTTRTPLLAFGGGPNVERVVDAFAKIYPVDQKRIYLVGHSMGAAQAVATAGRSPKRFAAVAALGGGGGFRPSDELKAVRFFVGCGERDFALNGSRNLHRQLEKAGVKTRFKSYADVEHLIIVQLALPEVFRFFEGEQE